MTPEQQPRPETNEQNHLTSAELEQLNRQLESKLEVAEQETEGQSERIQAAKAEIQRHTEELPPNEEAAPKPREVSGRERLANYRDTMRSLQRRLTPVGRKFSQFIHAPAIERASEALEKTVLRPSVSLGATTTALIIGSLFYFTARRYGFALSGSEFVLSILVGGLLGLVIELIWKLIRRRL